MDFNFDIEKVEALKQTCLDGGEITREDAEWLLVSAPKLALYEASHEITVKCSSTVFDTCSIINAKSGRCSEDCKWCSQSVHYNTDIETYPLIGVEKAVEVANKNFSKGISRLGIVNSGRKQKKEDIKGLAEMIRQIKKNSDIYLCGSLGLLSKDELKELKEAGLQRYHCNLETAPSYFGELCTTHTQEEKLRTLRDAKEVGLEICTGGIIGMGESYKQLVEFAFAIKLTKTDSLPFNLLNPIPGTPLEGTHPLSDDEVLSIIAMFRFVNPTVYLRFAGGRAKREREFIKRSFYVGINAAIMGDMLTTPGTSIQDEFNDIKEAGYSLIR